jgi:arsenite/tail-anchored protein-transporting ATPase
MALEETADAIDALESGGIHVDQLIVNRVTAPPPQPCAWCDGRRRFEARALAPVERRFAGREILAMPDLEREPRGLRALKSASQLIGPWSAPAAGDPPASRLRASLDLPPEGGSYRPITIAGERSSTRTLLLFGGKGGVGKSTCAAATALELAESRRVLLLSTDPAHSLGDVFGARLDNVPREIPGGPPSLHVREIDAASEMDRFRRKYVQAVDDAFARIARSAGGDQAAFRELIDLAPPGIDEVIAIADVAETITEGKGGYDVVVADTAPTGHALRLLQTPAVLRDWTLALMAILLKYREIVGAGTLAQLLVQLSKRLRGLQDILADASRCRFVVVTRAAEVPVDESLSLIDALRPIGIAAGEIVVNATGAGTCSRCAGIRQGQARAIKGLRRGLGKKAYAIIVTPAEIPPPHRASRLREWRHAWRRLT